MIRMSVLNRRTLEHGFWYEYSANSGFNLVNNRGGDFRFNLGA